MTCAKILLLTAVAIVCAVAPVASADARTYTGVSTTASGQGYVLTADTGETYAFGQVQYRDNPRGFTGQIAGISATADGQGYVAISTAGQVYAYGTVQYRGNPTGFTGQIAGISATADGQGYVAISTAGQVYAYGTVQYRGNPTGFTGQIAGISATADGQGYVAISTAGQVYAYGTVQYRGNPTGFTGQIAGISATADGQGYVAISTAGQVYAYGTVQYRGNPTGFTGQIAGISATADGQGYVAVSTYGQAYAYGTARYGGNGTPPPAPPAAVPADPGPAPATCSSAPGPGDAVTRWRPVVVCVLGMLGQPATEATVKNVFIIISFESRGDPRAINRTDINARNGDPSRGLMQTIGATFNGNRSRLLPNDIYDPAANIYAGLHYGIGRYRSIANIPGVKSVNSGGRYRPYAAAGEAGLTTCSALRGKGFQLYPTVDGMTCAQARGVVRSFLRTQRAFRLTRGRPATARTFGLRSATVSYRCQLTRFGAPERERLNGASHKASCRSGARGVTWTAVAGTRKR